MPLVGDLSIESSHCVFSKVNIIFSPLLMNAKIAFVKMSVRLPSSSSVCIRGLVWVSFKSLISYDGQWVSDPDRKSSKVQK